MAATTSTAKVATRSRAPLPNIVLVLLREPLGLRLRACARESLVQEQLRLLIRRPCEKGLAPCASAKAICDKKKGVRLKEDSKMISCKLCGVVGQGKVRKLSMQARSNVWLTYDQATHGCSLASGPAI